MNKHLRWLKNPVPYTAEERTIKAADEAQELQEYNASRIAPVEWTTSGGQHVRVECDFDTTGRTTFSIDIDEQHVRTVDAESMTDLAGDNAPGIVARLWKLGLTAEQRDALKAMVVQYND